MPSHYSSSRSSPMSNSTSLAPSEVPYASSSKAASTAPSSPPPSSDVPDVLEEEEEDISDEDKKKWEQLGPFLDKVSVYAKVLKEQMDKAKTSYVAPHPSQNTVTRSIPVKGIPKFETDHQKSSRKPRSKAPPPSAKGKSKKRVIEHSDEDSDTEHDAKRAKVDDVSVDGVQDEQEQTQAFRQPALVTGAKLKDYQLEGVAWMAGLFQNGISGILADEMGLGKTLQTIAFNAYLRERSPAPFLVVCPLSVLYNWVEEFKKFAPEIPVCMYHGSPEERAELRSTQMVLPKEDLDKYWIGHSSTPRAKSNAARKRFQSPKKKKASSHDDEDVKTPRAKGFFGGNGKGQGERELPPYQKTTFPVVITTYEMLMKDRVHLVNYRWGFIVVDEGHRLKNMDCKLMQEIKQIRADGRMVLTGTPLQNNLAELWSLLNFVLPDIFTDLYTFQEWFNLPTMQATVSSSRSSRVIHSLHAILRPFLLRRLKVDVETDLPPKKEYVLYAPLSERQRELYDAIVRGGLRALLLKEKGAEKKKETPIEIIDDSEEESGKAKGKTKDISSRTRSKKDGTAKKGKRSYADMSDREYFKKLDSGELEAQRQKEKERDAEELGKEWFNKSQLRKVNNMKLQNTVMQLRKVCSHPFLFDWPVNPITMEPVLNEELITASGKMMVLERLLDELFSRGHKVLLFSQFTTMLDIIEDWATEFKQWPICRIDGSTSMTDRRDEVNTFQTSGDDPDAPRLFLLSTRSGGLGLNLVAADTVIFYDQDWNPQMDLQAQDRAHRIGQTKPVLIFRLVSAHTIETKIMQRATEKRQLEALVIAKGKFKSPTLGVGAPGVPGTKQETIAELAASLLKLEGEKIQVVPRQIAGSGKGRASVLSDKDLDMLLDRRPEVFVDRQKGWNSTTRNAGERTEEVEKAAFAVYEAPAHEGNDVLAGMMGEENE